MSLQALNSHASNSLTSLLFYVNALAEFSQSSFVFVQFIVCLCCAAVALNVHLSLKDPFGDDLNDLPTESFEIGLRRDARMVLAGPGPGTRGQDFAPVGEYGVDCAPTAL